MRIGTKSLLYGAHCFFLHPWFVALAWCRLYGFPWDPRLWVAFVVHDWGYWGKPNMDGPEGEQHPIAGALIMARLFGPAWGDFCLLHSRWFATRMNKRYSRLCVADKYAICLTPAWLYLPMVRATGELDEYMGLAREDKYQAMGHDHSTPRAWWRSVQGYLREWVMAHKDADHDDLWMNACAIKEPPMSKLPGYLDGGYEHGRYKVTKASGEPVSPSARYLVLRYDKDPHAVNAALAYAVSVLPDNPQLHDGIIAAVRTELALTPDDFRARFGRTLSLIQDAFRPEGAPTLAGDAFREAMLPPK